MQIAGQEFDPLTVPSYLDAKSFTEFGARELQLLQGIPLSADVEKYTDQITEELEKLNGQVPHTLAIFLDRLGDLRHNVTIAVPVFFMESTQNPGELVLWAWTVTKMIQKSPNNFVRLVDIMGAFNEGFPNEEEKANIWDSQKGSNFGLSVDNTLDHFTFSDVVSVKH